MARVEFPDLDPAPYLALLDSHARELRPIITHSSGAEFIRAANSYLFEALGFRGNRQQYYHANNSCLNQVLVNRTGIPITLSLVYMEIARRLHRPVVGIGLPGHFLIRYQDSDATIWVDCFRGSEVSFEECRALALETARIDILAVPSALSPVTKWQIAVRMLNNLRNVYFQNRDWPRATWILDRLIEATPHAPTERKQRGVLRLEGGDEAGALEDFEVYLAQATHADPDWTEIASQAVRLRGAGGPVN